MYMVLRVFNIGVSFMDLFALVSGGSRLVCPYK